MAAVGNRPSQPWWVWASAVVATSILAFQIQARRYDYVMVVGGGAVAGLDAQALPAGLQLRSSAKSSEGFDETAERVETALQLRPPILVIGLDAGRLVEPGAVDTAKQVMSDLAAKAARADTRTIIVGFAPPDDADEGVVQAAAELNEWMRAEVCARDRVTCVTPFDQALAEGLRGALADAGGR